MTIGFVLAVPPGPVAVSVMAAALRGRWRLGFAGAAGAAIADGVIAAAVLFASSALVNLTRQLLTNHPAIAVVGEVTIAAALVTYAIRLARTSVYHRSSQLRRTFGDSARGTAFGTAVTAVANLFNPTFLPSLTASLAAATTVLQGTGGGEKFVLAFGFTVGTFGWLAIVVALIVRNHERFTIRHIALLRRIGAVVVLVFAGILLWHAAIQ
ncbi:MAG: LysE family transporter [Chlorobi bacterium]|nr:LysE family transporter [Chlorobiota bacterium]